MKKEFFFIASGVFALSISAFGQEEKDWRLYEKGGEVRAESPQREETRPSKFKVQQPTSLGKISYHQDSRISKLDSLKKKYPTLPNGYRLQIFFGDRETAREKRAEFLRNYPEVGAHISYLAPNFRLRIGDFRSRLECEKFKAEIGNRYQGSFIVKDKIELPNLNQ